MGQTPGPFAAFQAADLAYALDDGMPFPDWSLPLLADEQARSRYETGERFAVIAGDPANPDAGLVLDRANARLALRRESPPLRLVYAGAELALAEATWVDHEGRHCWARRVAPLELRVARRRAGAVVWVEEFIAFRPAADDANVVWPSFGDWAALDTIDAAPWVGVGVLELIDADGWVLDALEGADVPAQWAELGRRYDAPRAMGLPPEVQAKLAEPLGWHAAGRRWRKAEEVTFAGSGRNAAAVTTDALFAAGAGASGEIVTTVIAGDVTVTVDLPSATARCQMRRGVRPGSHPRPSTGAQVAVTAILEAGGAAHQAVVDAVRDGKMPGQWSSVGSSVGTPR